MGDNMKKIMVEKLEDVLYYIKKCEGVHKQQVAFSSYHNSLTQVCFDCDVVRTNIKLIDESDGEYDYECTYKDCVLKDFYHKYSHPNCSISSKQKKIDESEPVKINKEDIKGNFDVDIDLEGTEPMCPVCEEEKHKEVKKILDESECERSYLDELNLKSVQEKYQMPGESEEECDRCWNATCTPKYPCCDCKSKQKIEKLDVCEHPLVNQIHYKINQIIDYLNKE